MADVKSHYRPHTERVVDDEIVYMTAARQEDNTMINDEYYTLDISIGYTAACAPKRQSSTCNIITLCKAHVAVQILNMTCAMNWDILERIQCEVIISREFLH